MTTACGVDRLDEERRVGVVEEVGVRRVDVGEDSRNTGLQPVHVTWRVVKLRFGNFQHITHGLETRVTGERPRVTFQIRQRLCGI